MNRGAELLDAYLIRCYGKRGGGSAFSEESRFPQPMISRWRRGIVKPCSDHRVILLNLAGIPYESWGEAPQRADDEVSP